MATKKEILEWYLESGVTETIGEVPMNRFHTAETFTLLKKTPIVPPTPVAQEPSFPSDSLLQTSVQRATAAQNCEQLSSALNAFDGCSLKKTAKSTIFGEGVDRPDVLLIGEAPGADEDRLGRPFVGKSGILLDKIMASVGISRQTNAYITNIIPWRPPGNRNPSDIEISLCLPFLKRHIELLQPKIIVLLGGVALSAVVGKGETITRSRGLWQSYETPQTGAPIPLMPIFHPAFLLRNPAQKKWVWHDVLSIAQKLKEVS